MFVIFFFFASLSRREASLRFVLISANLFTYFSAVAAVVAVVVTWPAVLPNDTLILGKMVIRNSLYTNLFVVVPKDNDASQKLLLDI